ncbi:unnamed protein product [Paramecium pentaurelia]|uniref:Uncharacterized protein n=1 Tax=Paramecium pentaurelia TaxID=43138 RepID=A0A8S1XYQ8_9CILI|nr:unnamed protein product [Paramecium pentaurelia]
MQFQSAFELSKVNIFIKQFSKINLPVNLYIKMNTNDKIKGSEQLNINSIEISEEPQTVIWNSQCNNVIQIFVDKSFGNQMSYQTFQKYKSDLAKKILQK